MKAILDLIYTHSGQTLVMILTVLWYFFFFENKSRSALRLALFPLIHTSALLRIRENPAVLPVGMGYFLALGGIAMLLTDCSPYTYVIQEGVYLVFLTFCMTSIVLDLQEGDRRILTSAASIILIAGFCTILSMVIKSYTPMNILDLIVNVYTFLVSAHVAASIVVRSSFAEDMVAFFVFFGLVVSSFLHCLATIMEAFDFVKYFDFSYCTLLTILVFWLVSVPWIHHLKSRLT